MAGLMKRALLTRALACGVCLAAFAPTAASADIFDLVFTPAGGTADRFQIDTNSPAVADPNDVGYFTSDGGFVSFLDPGVFGGLNLNRNNVVYSGQLLFAGPGTSPTFSVGTFTFGGNTLTFARPGAAAPGGAAPEVGLGLLSLLAAAAALAMTRMRMPLLRRAAI